jgi:hypothetical protein
MRALSTIAICVGALLAFWSLAQAGDEPAKKAESKKPAIEVISVTIHPAAAAKPVLRHHLLPTFLECTPGNAAPYYLKAFMMAAEKSAQDDKSEQVVKWLTTPLGELPREQARETFAPFAESLAQVELAAHREWCRWDMPLRQGNVYEIALPEAQKARNMARLLALRARLQMAEGKHAEAIASLGTCYAMACHIAEQPFLVSGLVGMAIVRTANEQLLMLMQVPDAPNLYWSIAALPHPMIDMRMGWSVEYDCLYLQFPQLQNVRHANYTPEQWKQLLQEIVAKIARFAVPDQPKEDPAAVVARSLAAVPAAKVELLALGHSQKELDAMPAEQIAILFMVEKYDVVRDDVFKWVSLPYWQAEKASTTFDREFASARKQGLLPPTTDLLPAILSCEFVVARTERELAALRCIEALRLYAAAHNGKLPATLDDITEVPIPINLVTGKPFGYHLEGETAVLDAEGKDASGYVPQPRYRVTVAK